MWLPLFAPSRHIDYDDGGMHGIDCEGKREVGRGELTAKSGLFAHNYQNVPLPFFFSTSEFRSCTKNGGQEGSLEPLGVLELATVMTSTSSRSFSTGAVQATACSTLAAAMSSDKPRGTVRWLALSSFHNQGARTQGLGKVRATSGIAPFVRLKRNSSSEAMAVSGEERVSSTG